jgi:hypothetical protein
LNPLESSFSLSDVGNKEKHKEEESERKVSETISMNNGTPEAPKNVKIGAQCFDEEEMKFSKLLGEFNNVFSWYYEDLHGFDPGLIQHAIIIKEAIKPVRKKQRPINPAPEEIIRKGLEKILKAGIILPVKYSEWVSNLVPIWKSTEHIRFCVDFHVVTQVLMKGYSPLPNIEMILQKFTGSQMMPLLNILFSYNQIEVKQEDAYKTTFITNWGTMNYERMLSDASTTFKRPIQITLDELISIHIYLDDLIIYVKGMLVTSEFQVLWLGPFKINFVMSTNSYILKFLQ